MTSKTPASGTSFQGHPIAFSVMRMCGVDPVAAVMGTAKWPDDHVADYVENDDGILRMRIALDRTGKVQLTVNGPDACISARGQAFPDTAILGLPGLPIDRIVDHVLLTGAKHQVREAAAFDPDEDGVGTTFHLDGEPVEFVVP